MDVESGFFNHQNDANKTVSIVNEEFSEFTSLYVSVTGYSRVFLAKKGVRLYVIKCLKPEYLHDTVAQVALRKEYEAACYLDSPRVARTYDYLEIPDYGPSIIMEYCPGQTLGQLIEAKCRLSDGIIQNLVTGLLRAVEDIHASGIVHRDIKPDNIVCNTDSLTVKIIDFGCADGRDFFVLKGAAGTKGYVRPEVMNEDYETSVKDDYYSLGMTLTALMPLCSQSGAKVLARVSAQLCAGKKVASAQVESFFEHRHSGLWLIVIAILIGVVSLVVWLLNTKKTETTHSEKNIMENKQTPADNLPTTEALTPQESSVDTFKTTPELIAVPEENPKVSVPKPSEKVVTDRKSAPEEVESQKNLPAEGEYDDEYGVRYEEARNSKLYKQNEFDRMTIVNADMYMSTNYALIHKKNQTESQRELAESNFQSFDSLWQVVGPEIIKRFGEDNIIRAKGLARQRQKYWVEENFVPELLRMAVDEPNE